MAGIDIQLQNMVWFSLAQTAHGIIGQAVIDICVIITWTRICCYYRTYVLICNYRYILEERWVFVLWSQHVALGFFVSPIGLAYMSHFTKCVFVEASVSFLNG